MLAVVVVAGAGAVVVAATREDRHGEVEVTMRLLDEGLDGVGVFAPSSELDLRLRPRVIMGIGRS